MEMKKINLKINKKLAFGIIAAILVSAIFIYPLTQNVVKFGDFTEQNYTTKFKRAYGSLTGNWLMKNEGYPDLWSDVIWGNKDALHIKPGETFDIGAKVKNHGTEGTGENKGGDSLFQITTNFHDSYNNIFYGGRETYWYSDNVFLYDSKEYSAEEGKPLLFVHEGDKEQSVDSPYDYYAYRKPKIVSIVFVEGQKYAEEKIENGVYVWYLPALNQNKKEGNYVDLKMELAKSRLVYGKVDTWSWSYLIKVFIGQTTGYWNFKEYKFCEGEIVQTFHTRVYCDFNPSETTTPPTTTKPKDDDNGLPGLPEDMETELLLGLVIGIAVIAGIIVVILKKRK